MGWYGDGGGQGGGYDDGDDYVDYVAGRQAGNGENGWRKDEAS